MLIAECAADRARPGHHDRAGGYGERSLDASLEHAAPHEVVEARRAGQGHPGADYRARPNEDTLQERAAGTHEGPVLDDHRPGAGRLQDATDRDPGREVDVGADLGARADEHV